MVVRQIPVEHHTPTSHHGSQGDHRNGSHQVVQQIHQNNHSSSSVQMQNAPQTKMERLDDDQSHDPYAFDDEHGTLMIHHEGK